MTPILFTRVALSGFQRKAHSNIVRFLRGPWINTVVRVLRRWWPRNIYLQAFIAAGLVTVCAFPDVVFNQASLRQTDQVSGYYFKGELRNLYPVPSHTNWWDGYSDTGGALYQSEPMIWFMKNCIVRWDSPYWNPNSALGAIGPESLVDQKFSVFTILNALAGGRSFAYNFISLTFFLLGTLFFYLVIRQFFQLSAAAGLAAGTAYLLNGYFIANMGSNVTQSYPFIPVLLYASLCFFNRPNTLNTIGVIITGAIFLSYTFLPTTVVSILAIYIVIISFLLFRIADGDLDLNQAAGLVGIHALAIGSAVLVLAFLYFPIFENIGTLGTVDDYSIRDYFGLYFPGALLSFFSASHFFESYNAMEAAARSFETLDEKEMYITGNTTYHLGIVFVVLAGSAFSLNRRVIQIVPLVLAVGCIGVLLRLFDFPLFSDFISLIPIIGKIGNQYWWPALVVPGSLLVAFGIENLRSGEASMRPVFFLLLFAVIGAVYLGVFYGLREPNLEFKINSLAQSAVIAVLALTALTLSKQKIDERLNAGISLFVVVLLFGELIANSKMLRFERKDYFATPPNAAVEFVADRVGLHRTLNFGQTGMYPELGSAYGVQEMTTTNQGSMPSFISYFDSIIDLESSQTFGYNTKTKRGSFANLVLVRDAPLNNKFDWLALNLIGVKYVMIPSTYLQYHKELQKQGFKLVKTVPATFVFENPNAFERAFSLPWNDEGEGIDVTLNEELYAIREAAEITSYRNASTTIEGHTTGESIVVITDTWHQNWRVTVNGSRSKLMRVNGVFRGVRVPGGAYSIEMLYEPRSLRAALAISMLTVVLMVVALIIRERLDASIKSWARYG